MHNRNCLKKILGLFASLTLLSSIFLVVNAFGADYTVPSKKTKPEMPKHAKSNMQYKLSMKNKYMKIKATTGIQIDLPDAKKSDEKTKFKSEQGVKILTKSKGTMKKKIGVKTDQFQTVKPK
jgi:hypothetical protein